MSLILDGTNGLSDVDGTAGTPAIRGSDANTGVFFGTDIVGVSTGGSERVRVDASGNVGIGTSSPFAGAKLTAAGAIMATAAFSSTTGSSGGFDYSGGGLRLFSMGAGGATKGTLTFIAKGADDSSVTPMFIDSNNNFAIPTSYDHTTASAANVFIRSDGYLMRSTSALKYKQDIRDLESMDINLLRPVRYKSKCVGDDENKDHIGLIADEAAENGFEELIYRGADGEVEGFQYERLTVVLLKHCQELKAINDAQAQTIESLTARVVALENQIV